MSNLFIVIIICNNEIHFIDSYSFLVQAEIKAIELANIWYNSDGVKAYGLNKIRTIQDMNNYYASMPYFNCGDSVHVLIESAHYDEADNYFKTSEPNDHD